MPLGVMTGASVPRSSPRADCMSIHKRCTKEQSAVPQPFTHSATAGGGRMPNSSNNMQVTCAADACTWLRCQTSGAAACAGPWPWNGSTGRRSSLQACCSACEHHCSCLCRSGTRAQGWCPLPIPVSLKLVKTAQPECTGPHRCVTGLKACQCRSTSVT